MIEIEQQLLSSLDQGLLAVMILVIMFGMGATLTMRDFRNALDRPRGMIIGFVSQFGFMPLISWLLAHLLQLPPAMAIALIMVGCMPAGTTSNMFTYFARGSVALSVCMTAASTIFALVMTPLLLNFYASGFAVQVDAQMRAAGAETGFVIPYGNIIVSLLLVLLPIAGGMILLKKSPGWAKVAEDTAGFMAVIVILFLLGSAMLRHSNLFFVTPWQIYAGSVGVGVIGFLFGYVLAGALRMAPRYKRAISLETGIQNGPLCFAIIILSFEEPLQSQMLWLAILYATFIVLSSSLITLIFRRIGRDDWAIYRNNQVHQRLFGKDYVTRYPAEVVGDIDQS